MVMVQVRNVLLFINNDQKVSDVTVSTAGQNYTYGNVDLEAGGVPTGTTRPTFDVIISPPGGHGKDIYRELGAYNVFYILELKMILRILIL